MKNFIRILLRVLSYLLVFALGAGFMLVMVPERVVMSKLDMLEEMIDQRFIAEYSTTDIEDAAADAMVNALGDRWSYYIPASQYAAYEERSDNSYVGVGITIQRQEEPAGLLVVSVVSGGGAEEAGVLPGDVIVAIEGQETADMSTDAAKNLVRGEEGTTVSFRVLREEETLDFSIIRRKYLTTVAEGSLITPTVGMITITNFDSRCAEESIAAIEALREQGAEKLIFDVRFNPGGYASELVKLLDYLLPEGDLFRSEDYTGKTNVDRSGASFLDMPIAVLCNGDSYSAAEFFAAAIQEYEAGTIIGEQTCGKGYFQVTYPFPDGSAVALSIGRYFTPKGNSLIGVGVVPDIVVELDEETAYALYLGRLDPLEDPQVLAALEALE